MREIMFRGKQKVGDYWICGDLRQWSETRKGILDYSFGGTREVYPETIGQFTGLTDKNGKKIFEGDIVKSEFTQKPYKVCFGEYTYTDEYGDEESAYGWYNEEEGGYATAFGSPDAWATVIGNIHDNPELMEATE